MARRGRMQGQAEHGNLRDVGVAGRVADQRDGRERLPPVAPIGYSALTSASQAARASAHVVAPPDHKATSVKARSSQQRAWLRRGQEISPHSQASTIRHAARRGIKTAQREPTGTTKARDTRGTGRGTLKTPGWWECGPGWHPHSPHSHPCLTCKAQRWTDTARNTGRLGRTGDSRIQTFFDRARSSAYRGTGSGWRVPCTRLRQLNIRSLEAGAS